jgi:hypothetical protein
MAGDRKVSLEAKRHWVGDGRIMLEKNENKQLGKRKGEREGTMRSEGARIWGGTLALLHFLLLLMVP